MYIDPVKLHYKIFLLTDDGIVINYIVKNKTKLAKNNW